MIEQQNGYQTEDAYEGLLTIKEAATYVGMSYDALLWNAQQGKVERKKIDGTWRISIEALDAFKAKRGHTIIPVVDASPIEDIPPVQQVSPPVTALSEADMLARVIATAFAQAGQGVVKLTELREVTPPQVRVWHVILNVDGVVATYRIYSDGQTVSTTMPMTE